MIQRKSNSKLKGFSLIELLSVLVVFSLIIGGLFLVLSESQHRYQFEQDVAEAQQAARNALDMMEREMRLAGFPKLAYYHYSSFTPAYTTNSNTVAAGFTTVGSTNMIFEGDINEDGIVEVVQYRLNGSTLERSAVSKPGGGVPATPDFKTLAENVRSLTFTYLNLAGAATTVPADVRAVRIDLNLSTNRVDPETRRLRTFSISSMAAARNL